MRLYLDLWDSLYIDPKQLEQQVCFKALLFEPYFERSASHIRPLNNWGYW